MSAFRIVGCISYRWLHGSTYRGRHANWYYHPPENWTIEAPALFARDEKCVIHLYKKTALNFNFVQRIGKRTVRTDDSLFDSQFIIECEDEKLVKGLITAEIQHELIALSKNFSPRLYIGRGAMSFAVIDEASLSEAQCDRILSVALMIFSQAKRIFPRENYHTHVQEIDRENLPRSIIDMIKEIGVASIIILIGLMIFGAIVMAVLN